MKIWRKFFIDLEEPDKLIQKIWASSVNTAGGRCDVLVKAEKSAKIFYSFLDFRVGATAPSSGFEDSYLDFLNQHVELLKINYHFLTNF